MSRPSVCHVPVINMLSAHARVAISTSDVAILRLLQRESAEKHSRLNRLQPLELRLLISAAS